jgi:4-hydroxy-tetrahydrodipicolinate reductase
MGRLVEALAPSAGFEVVGCLDADSNAEGAGLVPGRWDGVSVAVEVSTAEAAPVNVARLASLGINVVVGTTGWSAAEAAVRRVVSERGIGLVAAPTFALGAVVLEELARQAAALLAPYERVGAWLHEAHHAAKKDAPSGTALRILQSMRAAGWPRGIDVSSTRAGSIPGTHEIGFDGPFDSVTLTHAARDRSVFAHGALVAARWVVGRQGWFTMRDVLALGEVSPGGASRDVSSSPAGVGRTAGDKERA